MAKTRRGKKIKGDNKHCRTVIPALERLESTYNHEHKRCKVGDSNTHCTASGQEAQDPTKESSGNTYTDISGNRARSEVEIEGQPAQ